MTILDIWNAFIHSHTGYNDQKQIKNKLYTVQNVLFHFKITDHVCIPYPVWPGPIVKLPLTYSYQNDFFPRYCVLVRYFLLLLNSPF